MAISPLIPISKSLNVVKGAAGLTRKTLGSISNALTQKEKDRKTIGSSIKILKSRRQQNTKRQIMQDAISAPTIVTRYKGPSILSSKSDNTNFTSRILGFIGYFSAGWVLSNMPTWISIGEQFTRRIYQSSDIIKNIGSDLVSFIFDIGGVFNAAFSNLRQFDFTDSSGNLNSSLEELSDTIASISNNLESALSILTQPFVNVPELGSRSERPSAYDEPTQPPTQKPSGGNPDFWLLSLISLYENSNPQGAVDVAQSIYNRMGYSGRTARQEILAKNQYEPVGKFGSVADWNKVVDRETAIAHIKKYPGNGSSVGALDKVAAALTNKSMQQSASRFVGNRPDFRSQGFEKQYNDMTNDATRYGQTFGFNRGSSYLGKSSSAASVPSFVMGSPSTARTRPQTIPGKIPTAVIDEINVSGPRGGTSTVGRSGGRGEYLSRGGRHKGIDIGTSGQKGYYVSFAKSGKVTYAGWNDGGYGYLVIIRSGNLEFFFAHLAKIMVKNNSPYNGETIGEIGNTGRSKGEHLHFEVRVVGGGAINPQPYLQFLSIGKRFSADFQGKETVQPVTPITPSDLTSVKVDNQEIQIDSASLVTFNKLFERLSTEQNKRKILIIDDSKPTSSPRIISGGSMQSSPGVSEFTLVNNFMKNKLLLDLTYL